MSNIFPAFEFGRLMMTKAISDRVNQDDGFRAFIVQCFDRYLHCDWGNLEKSDRIMNDKALIRKGRLLASYKYPETEEIIWIITEADRSTTTILYRHEY